VADYDVRSTQDYLYGQLSAGVGTFDTTLTSAKFANLPSDLSTTKYMPITLTDTAAGLYEVVWVTAHTAASTSVTVVRGREGTSAQAWAASAPWTCAQTARDALPITTRAGLPTDANIGQRVYVSDETLVAEKASGGWAFGAEVGGRWMRSAPGGDQSIPNITDTVILFANQFLSTPLLTASASGTGTKWTVNRAGLWVIVAQVRYNGSAAVGERFISIELVGAGAITASAVATNANFPVTLSPVAVHMFSVGQAFHVNAYQSSGGALTTATPWSHVTAAWLRD
jgi:hypothetical protein